MNNNDNIITCTCGKKHDISGVPDKIICECGKEIFWVFAKGYHTYSKRGKLIHLYG